MAATAIKGLTSVFTQGMASWPPNNLIKTGVGLITILCCSLNLISNDGQSTVELIGQCSDLVGKWPMADHYIVLCCTSHPLLPLYHTPQDLLYDCSTYNHMPSYI